VRTAPNKVFRRRLELGIAIASPLLDLVLAFADRVSRVLGPGEPERIPESVRRDGGDAPRSVYARGWQRPAAPRDPDG
jgi:hypothetical protein